MTTTPQNQTQTRREYRSIKSTLVKARLEKRGLNPVNEALPHVEETFRKVDRTLEAALDAEVVAEMSNMASEETRRLERGSTLSFNVDDYVKCLAVFLAAPDNATDEPDSTFAPDSSASGLAKLGIMGYKTSLRPPLTDFMVGPLAIEHKQRAAVSRTRKVIDAGSERNPTNLHLDDVKHGKKMTEIIQEIFKRLVAAVKTAQEPVGLFEYVLNPFSFSQSVENLFYMSFLVHDGKVKLDVDEFNVPVISPQPELPVDPIERRAEERRRAQAAPHQMIFDLDYQTWRELCEAFGISQSMIPQRQPEAPRDVNTDHPTWYS